VFYKIEKNNKMYLQRGNIKIVSYSFCSCLRILWAILHFATKDVLRLIQWWFCFIWKLAPYKLGLWPFMIHLPNEHSPVNKYSSWSYLRFIRRNWTEMASSHKAWNTKWFPDWKYQSFRRTALVCILPEL